MPCHNDLLNANFIDDGERLRIVDWEYAGMGDRFFDLANFSINHELDADERARCSRPTSARRAPTTRDALELMRFMSDFREAMWGVVQRAVSELDFDFDALRGRALRAPGADGGEPAFRRRARRLNDEGRPRRPSQIATTDAYGRLRSEARTRRACSSSSRSSSSSVPMRTGPLNQFFAEMNHQPPKTMPMPANQRIV